MAKKTKSKSTKTATSSWWNERSKVLAKTTDKPVKGKTKKVKAKAVKAKKAKAAEKGDIYYCESCGCELVCVEAGEEASVVCCDEPMMLFIR